MANGFVTAGGGGGGTVILRAIGAVGGTVTATLNGKTRTGTIGADGALQLKLPNVGLWHVSSTFGSGKTLEQDVKVYRYGITECIAPKPFKDCTPAEIQSLARTGRAKEFWQIGDEIPVRLTGGEDIVLQIYDFDHDYSSGGERKLPLTLGMKNCLNQRYALNDTESTYAGWCAGNFYKTVLPAILEDFPADWQAIMIPCQKKYLYYDAQSRGPFEETGVEKLFIPSEPELFGKATTHPFYQDGTGYSIFTDDASRVKTVSNETSNYLTRTPYNAEGYVGVNGTGALHGYPQPAGTANGITIVFCVG